ncbi:MAG: LptF/LptG family permease [Phycisphaerae bacterium]
MTILDKYLLRALAANYVIALAVMMSLYVVLDLFFNIDEFTEAGGSAGQVLSDIFSYYWPNLFRYFGQLSGVITLFACLVAISRLRKTNELTAMLASGISLYRVAAPVVAFSLLTTVLWVIDTELAIPAVAPQLARKHDDVRAATIQGVWFLEDGDHNLLSAREFKPETDSLRQLMVLIRDENGTILSVIEAEQAQWVPIEGHPAGGKWILTQGIKRTRDTGQGSAFGPSTNAFNEPLQYYESELDPRRIQQRQSAGWISFLSSRQLGQLAQRELPAAVAVAVQQARHQRYTAPLNNLVLLLLGLPFLLDRERGSILSDSCKCLALCGISFVFTFLCQSALSGDSFSALPTWLPIIVFAPVAVILTDRIRT